MTIRTRDTVRFLDNYGNCYWMVLTRWKRTAKLRILGRPDGLVITTSLRNLELAKPKNRSS